MADKKFHTEKSAVATLQKKQSIKFSDRYKRIIFIKEGFSDIGNKSWGKIDYLMNYQFYGKVLLSNAEFNKI